MTPFGWQHAKVKSTKSNPPLKVAKSAFMGTLIEQPPQAQIRPNAKHLGAHQIANDKTIILSTENVQKSILGQSYGGLKNGVAKLAKIL